MFFDPEPKKRKEDFFNMEEELKRFEDALKSSKLILVTGLRRYGKTSLILTALNESNLDYIFLDCRLLPQKMISAKDVADLLEAELSKKPWSWKLLEGIESVSIGCFGVRFKKADRSSIIKVLERLEGKILVIDEAQELRRSNLGMDSILAYIFDHLKVRIVVSGSQVGMLYRFLRLNEPEAPLFGRPYVEIRLRKLEKEKAEEFLRRGFEMEGLKVEEDVIKKAAEKFDGVIGWLAYFGFSYARGGESIEEIFEKASKLAASEVEHALSLYGAARKRYEEVLKIIATLDSARWSDVKRGLEAKLGKIPNNTLSAILKNLVDLGFVEKLDNEYRIADPILKNGVLRYL
ncbi:MAG: uncharacterized protein PWQ22_1647 [Archaeoglobaceae archaeon]|nr:uncharacterized protein [Archaeoglobaceae archaeon]